MNLLNKYKDFEKVEEYAISYLKMRRLIGIFGFALPIVLIAGSFIPGGLKSIQPSISDYYDTYMRDIFVGVLCAVSLFLLSYRGFNFLDNLAAGAASVFALGVAFFPTNSDCDLIHYLHLGSASLFFITLSFISIFLFTLTKNRAPAEGRKIIRNRIYRICGYIMLACIILLVVYIAFLENRLSWMENHKPVFVLESLALFAFGTSWLIKGKTLWMDKEETQS